MISNYDYLGIRIKYQVKFLEYLDLILFFRGLDE